MHRLLQSLPDIPRPARIDLARRYLARCAGAFSAAEHETMIEQVRAVLDDPRFAELFAPGSRAEVSIVGRLGPGGITVSGQVDRLAVAGDSVLIADYKTNRSAPRRLEDVPPPYIRQLALYRAVLTSCTPTRPFGPR